MTVSVANSITQFVLGSVDMKVWRRVVVEEHLDFAVSEFNDGRHALSLCTLNGARGALLQGAGVNYSSYSELYFPVYENA